MKKGIALFLLTALLLGGCMPALPEKTEAPTVQTQPAETQAPTEPEPQLSLVALEIMKTRGGVDYGYHQYEYPLWKQRAFSSYEREDALPERNITVNGISYTGTYWGTKTNKPNTYTSDCYSGDGFSFALNSETGELVSFEKSEYPSAASVQNSERKLAADAYAGTMLDLNAYEVQYKSMLTYDGKNRSAFIYTRYVAGFPTNDKLRVEVASYGEVVSYDRYALGSFEPAALPEDYEQQLSMLTEEAVEEAIAAKLQEIYRDFYVFCSDPVAEYHHQITEQTLVMMPDDTLLLYNRVQIQFKFAPGETDVIVLEIGVKCQREGEALPDPEGPEYISPQILETEADGLPVYAYRLTGFSHGNSLHCYSEDPFSPVKVGRSWNNEQAPEELQLFLGEHYTGQHYFSLQPVGNMSTVDCYYVGFRETGYEFFSVDAKTGVPVAVHITQWRSGESTNEECRKIADSYASKYMGSDGWVVQQGKVGVLYRYIYYRYAPEESLCDWMVITIASSGQLESLFRGTLALPEDDGTDWLPQILALLSDEAYLLFAKKRNETFDILKKYYLAQYEDISAEEINLYRKRCNIWCMRLLFLPDGNLGALYNLNFQLRDPGKNAFSTEIDLLLRCGE